ncbi:MAG: hypothetical protein HOY79_50030 [Streptomyces sp.]|nr:hypothetical protein [Streptomyces sp.]
MIADAFPALLRIRAVAALVLARSGYDQRFITSHLGPTAVPADPADVTAPLLAAAAAWFRDLGCPSCGRGAITYYEVAVVIERFHEQFTGRAWDRGLLFELEAC